MNSNTSLRFAESPRAGKILLFGAAVMTTKRDQCQNKKPQASAQSKAQGAYVFLSQ
jgi:hypothetical protein